MEVDPQKVWLIQLINLSEANNNVMAFNKIITEQNITGLAVLGFIAILLLFFIKVQRDLVLHRLLLLPQVIAR